MARVGRQHRNVRCLANARTTHIITNLTNVTGVFSNTTDHSFALWAEVLFFHEIRLNTQTHAGTDGDSRRRKSIREDSKHPDISKHADKFSIVTSSIAVAALTPGKMSDIDMFLVQSRSIPWLR